MKTKTKLRKVQVHTTIEPEYYQKVLDQAASEQRSIPDLLRMAIKNFYDSKPNNIKKKE
jgi:hypothetical protein